MNTNLLNQTPQVTERFIKSIPTTEFYNSVLTRAKIANIYDKYYIPNQTLYQLTQDQVLRAIINSCLRYINMSIQDISVLLVYGLNTLSRADLDITENHLAEKLAQQNQDKNDIDIVNRIVAQIVTKLPADLHTKLTPFLRIRIIQKLTENIKINDKYDVMYNKNKEGFQNYSNGNGNGNNNQTRLIMNNIPQTTSLDNNFLKEEQDIRNSLGNDTVTELEANGYSLDDIAKSNIDMRFNAGDYEHQLQAINSLPIDNKVTKDIIPENVIDSTYIQHDPQLQMDAKTKELYYFDEYSGTLTPISDVAKIKGEDITTEKQINTLLKDHNLSKAEVDHVLRDLKTKGPITTEEENATPKPTKKTLSLLNMNNTTYLIYGGSVILAIVLTIIVIMMLKKKVSKHR